MSLLWPCTYPSSPGVLAWPPLVWHTGTSSPLPPHFEVHFCSFSSPVRTSLVLGSWKPGSCGPPSRRDRVLLARSPGPPASCVVGSVTAVPVFWSALQQRVGPAADGVPEQAAAGSRGGQRAVFGTTAEQAFGHHKGRWGVQARPSLGRGTPGGVSAQVTGWL